MSDYTPRKRNATKAETVVWLMENATPAGSGCWKARGYLNNGYKLVRVQGVQHYAHRLVTEHYHGPAPFSDCEACHSCGNRWCIASLHLRWCTPRENARDREKAKREARHMSQGHRPEDAGLVKLIHKMWNDHTSESVDSIYNALAHVLQIAADRIYEHEGDDSPLAVAVEDTAESAILAGSQEFREYVAEQLERVGVAERPAKHKALETYDEEGTWLWNTWNTWFSSRRTDHGPE